MKIGEKNILTVSRLVDFGAYLADNDGNEVLLPARYLTGRERPGVEIEVFVHTDSEDRPVATTETPKVTVGEFAFLDVKATCAAGAFLDWGLAKDLLVPYSEQKSKMRKGGRYFVYVYLDNASGRPVASARIEKFLGNVFPDYRAGQKVRVMVYGRNELGWKCVVDNRHQGMLYFDQVFKDIAEGDVLTAYVRRVRPDGKIDLYAEARADVRTDALAAVILKRLSEAGGALPVGDRTDPAEIRRLFQCSKKDFKKAVGHLLKEGKIGVNEAKTSLFCRIQIEVQRLMRKFQ